MATKLVQDSSLTSIANAIRAKSGTSAQLEFPTDFVSAIQNIPTGGGGGTTIDPLSVTQNGTYTAPTGHAYSPVTVNVSSSGGGGGNSSDPVKFIDYDGTVLYSYSVSDFMALNAMPANPTHTGLTAQGWNWSLADAKAYVAKYGRLNIGQMYVTASGDTEIDIQLGIGRNKPYLGCCPNGTVDIDWGDGSAHSTLTGTSTSTLKSIQHTYPDTGEPFTITLHMESGSLGFIGSSSSSTGSQVLFSGTTGQTNGQRAYQNAVKEVRCGSHVTSIGGNAFQNCYSLASMTIPDSVTSIGAYAFQNCYSLTSVTIPEGVTSIGGNAFYGCSSLTSVTIPEGVTSIGAYAFYGCSSLASVTIPDSVTSIGSKAFQSCYSLTSVTIPEGVTSIESSAFQNCYSLASLTIPDSIMSIGDKVFQGCYCIAEYHFESTTPPTLGTTAFSNIQSDCVIYVPTGSLEAYQTATNWSTYASYIQEEPT